MVRASQNQLCLKDYKEPNQLTLKLFLEIADSNYVFFVSEIDQHNNCKIVYKLEIPLKGIDNCSVSDFEIVYNTIKENILKIEQNFKKTFKLFMS